MRLNVRVEAYGASWSAPINGLVTTRQLGLQTLRRQVRAALLSNDE